MLAADDGDCDACVPAYLQRRHQPLPASAVLFSSLPFILTFLIVATAVIQRLFPLLAGNGQTKDRHHAQLPSASFNPSQTSKRPYTLLRKLTAKRVAALTFSASIALSAVLVELLLCEISNALNPTARSLALNVTISSLLFLLIIVTPALELHSAISAAGWSFEAHGKSRFRLAWLLEGVGLAAWLFMFWYAGDGMLGSWFGSISDHDEHGFMEGCLERIGVIGVSLMASLAGFAAVSSLWQTFGVKSRPVRGSLLSIFSCTLTAFGSLDGALSESVLRLSYLTRPLGRDQSELTKSRSLKQTLLESSLVFKPPTICWLLSRVACVRCSGSYLRRRRKAS